MHTRLALAFLFSSLVACSKAPAQCDIDCTTDSQCGPGTACLEAAGGSGMACLPTQCRTCPLGHCGLGANGCGYVECTP